MTERYEYLTARLAPFPDDQIHEELLMLGNEGWKLVACEDGRWIFIRPVNAISQPLDVRKAFSVERNSDRAGLTKREAEVAGLVAQGLNNRAISSSLKLQEQSVKNMVSAIMRKLQVENRTQVALRYHELFPV